MNTTCRRSFAAISGAALLAAACGGTAPAAPGPTAPGAGTAVRASEDTLSTPLSAGTLTMASERNGSLSGTYDGAALGAGSETTAQVTLTLTGGTGAFAGATGSLRGRGVGSFTGEGGLSLVLDGILTTPLGSRHFRLSTRGTATLSCLNEQIVLTLHGTGTSSGSGRVTTTASHTVGNSSCDR